MKIKNKKSPHRHWIALCDAKDDWIRRGSIIRVVDEKKEAKRTDASTDDEFLVFDPLKGDFYGLICLTGENAGLIHVVFPINSSKPGQIGLRRDWLIENWNTWVQPNSLPSQVLVKSA